MSELNYASALATLDGEFEAASAQTGGSTNNTWRHSEMTSAKNCALPMAASARSLSPRP